MMTDATRASAEALPKVSDLLRRTIERHEAAYAYFESTCYLSDRSILGREPTVEEQGAYKAANDAEAETLSDVCYFPARTPADLAVKARHLRKYHCDRRGYLESWQVENLLRSMPPEAERDALDDGDEAGKGGEA